MYHREGIGYYPPYLVLRTHKYFSFINSFRVYSHGLHGANVRFLTQRSIPASVTSHGIT